jgi:hypothetical protein
MNHRIPVHLVGFTMQVTADEARPILELDPFFLQGTDSTSGLFVYISCELNTQDAARNKPLTVLC